MSESVKYLAINSPSLTLKLAGKRYTARNGVFEGLPAAAEKELDHMVQTMPHIRQEVKKVDMEEAVKKAKEHLAKQPAAAVKGVVTSGTSAASVLRQAREAQRPEALTGMQNPVNTSTKDSKPPLEVTTVNTAKPAQPAMSSLAKKT